MIDPHVHLRDWKQSQKEQVSRAVQAAALVGITGLFEMPNTDPPLVDPERIRERIEYVRKIQLGLGLQGVYGLYAGLTDDKEQNAQMVDIYRELFPAVIGFKLFAGHSTGHMGIIGQQEQFGIYQRLAQMGYRGIIAVHCEKESMMHPELFDPGIPATHSLARPPEAETASVSDQLRSAGDAGFTGVLHICHVSCPESIELIERFREDEHPAFMITTGVTPHHALLDDARGYLVGMFAKMNPPLRDRARVNRLFSMLKEGRIDWIESDHAPHTAQEKADGASGIPGFAGYAHLVLSLMEEGLPREQLISLTGARFARVAGLELDDQQLPSQEMLESGLHSAAGLYEWDLWELLQF
jgi:dihydroorotase